MWILLILSLPNPDAELARFPPRDVVQEYRAFNLAYQQHLEAKLAVYPRDEATRVSLGEARWLYAVWDALDDAQRFRSEYQWNALEDLRVLIGDDAYCRGRMPPPVPLWRFRERD